MLDFRILRLASIAPLLALCGCGKEDLKARDIRSPRWRDHLPDVRIIMYHSGVLTLGLNEASRRAFVDTLLQAEMKPVPKDALTAMPSLFVEIDGVNMSYLGPLWDERGHVYYINERFGWLGDLSHILREHINDIHSEEVLAAFSKYGIVLLEDKRLPVTIERGKSPRATDAPRNVPTAPVVDTLPTSWPQQARDLVILGDRYHEEATQHLRQSDPDVNPMGWADECKKARELYVKANEECYTPASDEFKAGEVPRQLLDRIRETRVRIMQLPRGPIRTK